MLLNCHLLPLEKAWLWFSPYNLVLSLLIVGDDVLGVPFIKISLRFARAVGGLAAARSRSRSDNTPCYHSLRSRRYATPAPTGLCAFDIFDCRGDHWSSVIY